MRFIDKGAAGRRDWSAVLSFLYSPTDRITQSTNSNNLSYFRLCNGVRRILFALPVRICEQVQFKLNVFMRTVRKFNEKIAAFSVFAFHSWRFDFYFIFLFLFCFCELMAKPITFFLCSPKPIAANGSYSVCNRSLQKYLKVDVSFLENLKFGVLK